MKRIKICAISFFVGIMFSVVPIAVYAACDETITFRDVNNCRIEYTCHLDTDGGCSNGVCICAYICEGCGHWTDGPCPEGGGEN